MKIVFMGTPNFSATILEYLAGQHDVVAVYTRPDAVRGRGNGLVASPVKAQAESLGIPFYTPTTLRDPEVQSQLASFGADVFCVAAYGMILPDEVLALPRYGCLNAHASLLPRWRGAAPIERALLAGDEQTGVCVMRMESGLDTGDYCVCRSMEIADRTASELTEELALLSAQSLLTALSLVEADRAPWTVQDEDLATYAHKIEKNELNISPDDGVNMAWRKVRCVSEGHPSKCSLSGRGVSLMSVTPATLDIDLPAGCLVLRQKRLYLGLADGVLQVNELKPDGKKAMDGASFAAGVQGAKSGNVTWGAYHG